MRSNGEADCCWSFFKSCAQTFNTFLFPFSTTVTSDVAGLIPHISHICLGINSTLRMELYLTEKNARLSMNTLFWILQNNNLLSSFIPSLPFFIKKPSRIPAALAAG
jgi:hypothetical protein